MNLASLQHAVIASLRDSSRVSDALLYLQDLAKSAGLRITARKLPLLPINAAHARAIDAFYSFSVNQTSVTASALRAALDGISAALGIAHALRSSVPMSQTAPLPEPFEPMFSHAPAHALEWQTVQAIGANPAQLVEFNSRLRSAVELTAYKHAKREQYTPKPKRIKPARAESRVVPIFVKPAIVVGNNPNLSRLSLRGQ